MTADRWHGWDMNNDSATDMDTEKVEKTLADSIEEVKRLGNQYAELAERQQAEIVELRARIQNLRRLREFDQDTIDRMRGRGFRPAPRLGLWAALRLWFNSLRIQEDEEEDGFGERS